MALKPRKHSNQSDENHPTKILFRIFQAIHHLIILRKAKTDQNFPISSKMIKLLDNDFFKVAGMDEDPLFLKQMRQGNRLWRYFHIQIQISHFERMLDFWKGSLSAHRLTKQDLSNHLITAKLWAKKNFKKKFKLSEFAQVEEIAHRLTAKPNVLPPNNENYPKNNANETRKILTRSTGSEEQRQSVSKDQRPCSSGQFESVKSKKSKRKRSVSSPGGGGKRHRDSESPCASFSQPPVGVELTQCIENSSRKRPAESSPESSPTSDRGLKNRIVSHSSTPEKTDERLSGSRQKYDRGSRFRALESLQDDDVVETTSTSKCSGSISSSPTSLDNVKIMDQQVENIGASPTLAPARATNLNKETLQPPTSRKSKLPFDHTQPKKMKGFNTSKRVKCFQKLPNNGHKKVKGQNILNHWSLPKVTKPKLVIGTSNFRRIENVDSEDVQVVSYSGLKLTQLSLLINAFEFGPKSKNPGMKPLDVVIMVGINDMGLAPTSNKSSLHRILTSLKSQFPGSRFSFCQVPIKSGMFKKTEVETIEALNKEIERLGKIENINVIPKIHDDDFEVDPVEPIHWTTSCADKTIKHILNHLN